MRQRRRSRTSAPCSFPSAEVTASARDRRNAGDVRRTAHNPEVAGSNSAPATKARGRFRTRAGLLSVIANGFANEGWLTLPHRRPSWVSWPVRAPRRARLEPQRLSQPGRMVPGGVGVGVVAVADCASPAVTAFVTPLRCRVEPYVSRRLRCASPRPGVSAGSALTARRRTPGHTAKARRSIQLTRQTAGCRSSWLPRVPSSSRAHRAQAALRTGHVIGFAGSIPAARSAGSGVWGAARCYHPARQSSDPGYQDFWP
jgi:hypothetical protein